MCLHLITDSKYMKQKQLKQETDKSTIMKRGFNTPQSVTDRQDRQKISKHKEDFNSLINKLDITGINEYYIPKQQSTHSCVARTYTNISSSQHSYQ